jgi:hypothetical protein
VLADSKGIKCSRFAIPPGVGMVDSVFFLFMFFFETSIHRSNSLSYSEINMSLESPLEGLQTYDLYPINTIQELIIRGTRTVSHLERLIPIAHFAPDISMDEYITDPNSNNV